MIPGRKPLLQIRALRTQFSLHEGTVTALDDVDLTIFENESLGIVGETGCGKSMTAFSVLRLVPPPGKIESGNVFFGEPKEVGERRIKYEAEAQAWYERQPLKKKQEYVATYGPRLRDRKGRLVKMTRTEVNEIKPPEKAPNNLIKMYLSQKAKFVQGTDKVGRDATQGTYDLLNKSNDDMRGVRGRQISMIFQDPSTSLDPVFTVGSQLGEVISLHQNIYDDAALRKKILDVLRLVRIAAPEDVMKQYPHELSGGMKQRVMIALALSCNPSLLIADEPTTALDVTIQAQVLRLLKDLVKGVGSSMMLITHNLGIVAETCDRVCIMYAGRMVEIAETFELFEKPMHPYTKGLLMAFPKLGEHRDELSVIRGTVPNLMKPFPGCSFVDRCDFATDECRRVRPTMVEATPGHFVSCHLYPIGGEMTSAR
jgi:oligopeptide/dipeptide ABC transporter ATP-binding protein